MALRDELSLEESAPSPNGEKPRVLHVITRLIRGGADENTILTSNGLADMGYRCMIAYGAQSEDPQIAAIDRCEKRLLPGLVRDVSPWHDTRALRHMGRLIREFKPDIVHTHTAKAGVIGRIAARLGNVPIIIHGLHGTTFHDEQARLVRRGVIAVERALAGRTTAYMSVSSDLSKLYLDHGIGRPEQYVTVRSGMDLSAFRATSLWDDQRIRAKRRELGVPEDEPLAVMLCRLEERKRVDRYIEAAAKLTKSGVRANFAIAGEGAQHAELEALAEGLGVGDRVHFLGFRRDVPEVLAASSAVCLTSKWEGLPRVFVQATAVGRMVVCYDVNGAREAIVEGVNGYIAPQENDELFRKRLKQVLEMPKNGYLADKVGNEHLSQWDVETMLNETARVYECLLRNGPLTEALRKPRAAARAQVDAVE